MNLSRHWSATLAMAGLMAMASAAQALSFAVNEGVTYRVSNAEIQARYAAMATDLSKLLQQPVTIEPIADYKTLRQGLADKRWELAMVHPAHVSIEAMKHAGYRLVAVTKGFTEYKAGFLVRSDAAWTQLTDLRGQHLGAPDEDSITSVMLRATLRDLKMSAPQVRITYTRYQDAVPFFVENYLTHAGVTASGAVLKAWQAKGGKILGYTRPVPIKHIIASPSLTTEQLEKVQQYLTNLDATEEGRKKLEPTKWKGFQRFDQAEMMKLGEWLDVR